MISYKTSFRFALSLFGENRVVLGSDYPFPLGEEHPGALIRESGLTQMTKQKLLYENAREWLGGKS